MNKTVEALASVALAAGVAGCGAERDLRENPRIPPEPTPMTRDIRDYPTATPDADSDAYTIPGHVIPMDEVHSVRPFDMPTFPEGYTPDQHVEITYLDGDELLTLGATNEDGNVIYMWVMQGHIPITGDTEEISIGGVFVNAITNEAHGIGMVRYQWAHGEDQYTLGGDVSDDVDATLSTMGIFQEE